MTRWSSGGGGECEKRINKPKEPKKNLLSGPLPRSAKVTILGAANPIGETLAFFLKLNPFVHNLRLYDEQSVMGLTADLRLINTSTKVTGYTGQTQLKNALNKADVVVILGGDSLKKGSSSAETFERNKERVGFLAQNCMKSCPEAIFVLLVDPINSTIPLFSKIFSLNGVLCPNRVLGPTALSSMRARMQAGRKLWLDPSMLSLPFIGGASSATAVPLFSLLNPGAECLSEEDREELSEKMKVMTDDLIKAGGSLGMSAGFAVFTFMNKVIKAFCGQEVGPTSAFIRSSTIMGVKYLTNPVVLDRGGVAQNLGLPAMSGNELSRLESALPAIQEDIARGENYGQSFAVVETSSPCELPISGRSLCAV